MNILFFDRCAIAPDKNGIAKVTHILTGFFCNAKHNVFYLAAKHDLEEFCDHTRQYFLPNQKRDKLACRENKLAFIRLLEEKQITHIIFQWGEGRCFPFISECKRRGIRVISAIHFAPDNNETKLKAKYALKNTIMGKIARTVILPIKLYRDRKKAKKIYAYNLENTDATVLLSSTFIENFKTYLPKNANFSKITAISNPLPLQQDFPPIRKSNNLLFVGRLDIEQKRIDLLLKIWDKIQAQFPSWSLQIIGDGKDRKEIERLIQKLNLKNVILHGFQDPTEYYKSAPIFCMTSVAEGFAMVLIEATSYACAPVVFDSFSAAHDIISHNKNGILVPAFDCDKYAEELSNLIKNSELRERIALQAQADVSKFSVSAIGEKWLDLFNTPT